MIATGGALTGLGQAATMGLAASGELDPAALRRRVHLIEEQLRRSVRGLLESQGVRLVHGAARFVDSHTVAVDGDEACEITGDVFVVATGSRPRVPDWAPLDGERVLTTREAYPPPEIPTHLCVIGSGVTGVEFTHMFSALGSEVSLVVSRQQVLPLKDAEVAAVLEDEFLARGVRLLKGARATGDPRTEEGVHVDCDDGRHVDASHVILAIGSVPNTEDLGLDVPGVALDASGYITINHNCITHRAARLRGRRRVGEAAALVGGVDAGSQDRRAPHGPPRARAPAPRLREGRVRDLHRAGDRRRRTRRGRRVLVRSQDPRHEGAVLHQPEGVDQRRRPRLREDHLGPATGVVLGGSIVGRSAAELISVIAVAATNNLRVGDIVDSLLVHPAMAESLIDAAS